MIIRVYVTNISNDFCFNIEAIPVWKPGGQLYVQRDFFSTRDWVCTEKHRTFDRYIDQMTHQLLGIKIKSTQVIH